MTAFSFMGEQTQRLIKRFVLTCLGDSTDVSSVICLLLGTTVDALELLLESDVSDMERILKNQKVLKYNKYCDDQHKDQKYEMAIFLF